MANLQGVERSLYVREMFGRIAARYDLMNRLMTAGQDVRWRKQVIDLAALPRGGWLLDLGAGTGDLTRLALERSQDAHAVAADFTLEMMQVGKKRLSDEPEGDLTWLGADAVQLPFEDNIFDAVISGFLLRNVANLPQALSEQLRVLKPSGRWVALDTSPPSRSPIAPLLRFHLHTIIPALGRLIAGQVEAYKYLPDSTESFLEPEQLADLLKQAGYEDIGFERRMLGTIAIHWGRKPDEGEAGGP